MITPPVISGTVTLSDGVELKYEKHSNPAGPTIVLIHGWSGSRHYFDRNSRVLAKTGTVYAYDQRFHGDSKKPKWGYHVARLAADLHEFLQAFDLEEVTVVGTSMGCAVIWSYVELFGVTRLAKAVFVDQAPLQNIAEDWKLHQKGIYDIASLTRLQMLLRMDFEGFAKGGPQDCLSRSIGADAELKLANETLKADPDALARLMADHTQLDWRPILPRISIPCLNIVGELSSIFPPEGCAVVGELIPDCHTVVLEGCNHWLYIEEPDKFNALVAAFASQGLTAELVQQKRV